MAKAKPITGLDVQAPTSQNAGIIARVRLEEVYEWSRYVDSPYAVREMHNLRIATKRLRYTLEIFADFLPDDCKAVVKELEQIQNELGELHDSDVMIALLRLCLGNQENPVADPKLLTAKGQGKKAKAKSFLRPELLIELLDPAVAPTAEERCGLEYLLRKQEQAREEQYQIFRHHWYRLQEQDFRRHLLDILDKEREAVVAS
jgi:CHAD domain-containing protein